MTKSINKKLVLYLSIMLGLAILILGSSVTSAAPVWPRDSFGGNALAHMERKLKRKNDGTRVIVHDQNEVFVGVYTNGNTSGSNVSFEINVIEIVGTVYYNSSLTNAYTGGNVTTPSGYVDPGRTDVISGDRTITLGGGVYDPDINMTKYIFHPYLHNLSTTFPSAGNDAIRGTLKFRLRDAGSVAQYGMLGGKVVSFQAGGAAASEFVDFSLPIGRCEPAGAYQNRWITLIDSDNRGPGVSVVQKPSTTYRPLGLQMSDNSGAWNNAVGFSPNVFGLDPYQDNNGWGWQANSGWPYRYTPVNSASNQNNSLLYGFGPISSKTFYIRDAGEDNFIAIAVPYDEIYGKTACTPRSAAADVTDTGPIDYIIGSGPAPQFDASISTTYSPAANPDSFQWQATGENATSWAWVAIAGTQNRVDTTAPLTNLTPGLHCRTVSVRAGVPWYITPDSSTQCINVIQPAVYIPASPVTSGGAPGNDYEKGGTLPTINHQIIVSANPCNRSIAVGAWVNPVNWQARQYSGPASTATGIGTPPVSGTVEFANCGNTVRVNGGAPVASPATLYPYTPNAGDTTTLINANPGAAFGRETFIAGASGTNPQSGIFTVFEAPFARFFGNDVKVCGVGTANRFVYDLDGNNDGNGDVTGNRFSGSFAEYASIYENTNLPNSSAFTGLQSSAINTTWAKLLSNYSALTAGNCAVNATQIQIDTSLANTSTIPGGTYGRQTIYSSGNINITGNIQTAAPATYTSTFDPDTFPIMIIYAAGDINISFNVNRIDAVLIAGGKINTCINALNNAGNISGVCRNPLKINGAVVAPTVNLQRSGGSRYKADTSSGWDDNIVGGVTKASEIIEYPWYLNYVNFDDLAKDSDGSYKAYYGLPPRL